MKSKLRLSPSRASDFRSCPQLYKFRVVDRLPEPPSEPQLRGTVVHKALELLFAMPAPERTRQAASRALEASLAAHQNAIEGLVEFSAPPDMQSVAKLTERIRSAGEKLLDNYFKLEDPASVEPIATEKWVAALLASNSGNGTAGASQTELIGVIDRIERTATGDIVVTDYKTGAAPSKNFERDAFFGLRFYSVILAESGMLAGTPSRIRLFYLQDAQALEDTVSDSLIASTSKLISAIAAAIEKAHASGDWRPNPSRLCDYCYFKPMCPAHQEAGATA